MAISPTAPLRQRVAVLVEHRDVAVVDRPADRDRVAVGVGDQVEDHADRGLGRPVAVGDPQARQHRPHPVHGAGVDLLAADDQVAQRGQLALRPLVAVDDGHERVEDARHEVGGGDLVLGDRVDGLLQVEELTRCRQHRPAAGDQRPQELPQRRIEGVLAVLQHHVVAGGAEPAGHEPQPVGQPAVPVQRALGGAGRARGEEPVAQVGGTQRGSRPPGGRRDRVDRDRRAGRAELSGNVAGFGAQDQPRRQHTQRGPQPLGGPAWVHRDEHGA